MCIYSIELDYYTEQDQIYICTTIFKGLSRITRRASYNNGHNYR